MSFLRAATGDAVEEDDDDATVDEDDGLLRSGDPAAISRSGKRGGGFFLLFLAFTAFSLGRGKSGKQGCCVGADESEKPKQCPTHAATQKTTRKNIAMAPKSCGVTEPTKGR